MFRRIVVGAGLEWHRERGKSHDDHRAQHRGTSGHRIDVRRRPSGSQAVVAAQLSGSAPKCQLAPATRCRASGGMPVGRSATALHAVHKRGSTKRRMLASAAEVLRERGAAGVTIDEVLSRSGAPRGSVYHHFPGGRNQILLETLQFAGDSLSSAIGNAASQGPMALLREFVDLWEDVLRDSDFAAGCPVVAAAISTSDEDPRLANDAAQIFDRWRAALTHSFVA